MHSAVSLMLIAILSCDSFKEDFIEPEKQIIFSQTEFFTLPGSSIAIDLKSVIEQSFTDVSLQITGNPSRGALSRDSFLLKYVPNLEFQEGKDEFTVTAMNNGEVLKSQTMTIMMRQGILEFPCGVIAIQDRAQVKSGSTVSINFLTNDRVCGTDQSDLRFSIYSWPRFGSADLVGNTIVYTPGEGYAGHDEMVYKVTTSAGDKITYGIVTITDDWHMSALRMPGEYLSNIFFVDEQIGYLSGSTGFFKTTDGGLHWEDVRPPSLKSNINDSLQFLFGQIFFLDADHGFITYREFFPGENDWYSYYGYGGLAITADGGTSWDVKLPGTAAESVFFISTTTGFVSEILESGTRLYKTTDGAQSWRLVLESTGLTQPEVLKVRFANATNGYAYHGNKLYVTADEGETWQLRQSDQYIYAVAAVGDNTFYTAYMPDQWESTTSIFRSEGATFQSIGNFTYAITNIEFSSSGDVGFALGTDALLGGNVRAIRSDDSGLTWKEQPRWGLPYNDVWQISVPSDRVAYFLSQDRFIKYSSP